MWFIIISLEKKTAAEKFLCCGTMEAKRERKKNIWNDRLNEQWAQTNVYLHNKNVILCLCCKMNEWFPFRMWLRHFDVYWIERGISSPVPIMWLKSHCVQCDPLAQRERIRASKRTRMVNKDFNGIQSK